MSETGILENVYQPKKMANNSGIPIFISLFVFLFNVIAVIQLCQRYLI